MYKNIIFVINDYFGHGGHVKSFIAQIQTIENLFDDMKIICANNGYIVENIHKFNKIKKENLVFAELCELRKIQFSLKLVNLIKDNLLNNSILHVYSPECYFSALYAKSYFKNILLINSVMGGPNPFPYFNSSDLYIAVSEEQISTATKQIMHYEDKRVCIIKNRVTLNKNNETILLKEKIILIVTRFDYDKLDSLIKIFSIIDMLPKKYRIIIAGSGELLNKYKMMYQTYNNIEFIGYCSNLTQYRTKTVVVLGMGRSILEFMLCKVPGILIGFNGIETLTSIDAVKFASSYNFAGRKIFDDVDNADVIERINYIMYNNLQIDEKIYLFLKHEYDVKYFKNKYLQLITSITPQQITRKQILIEFISFFKTRVIRTIRRKFDTYK